MQRITLAKLFNKSEQGLLKTKDWLLTLDKRCLFGNPSIMYSSRPKLINLIPRSSSLVRSENIAAPCFSTTTNRVQMSRDKVENKLVKQQLFQQNQANFFTRRVEEETVEVEGVGWAGQPIVKRLHTILPEVKGDVPDINKATKKTKKITEIGNKLDMQMRNFGRSHDIIAVINENARNYIKPNINQVKSRLLHSKKDKMYLQHSGILMNNPKKPKRKKRTVVLASKPALLKKRRLHKRKKPKRKESLTYKYGSTNKRLKVKSSMYVNRLFSTLAKSTLLNHVINRQFQTSAINGASRHGKSHKDMKAHDDCVCPEILYTKGRKRATKICGEAEGVGEKKKKSSWKPKMCRVKPKEDIGKPKTFVCMSEHTKTKRKKELPKCPKPEKIVVPRVLICAPNLIEESEKKKKKECVKIEEVKIRKRTKVCKPIIIFAKEEVGIKAEKSLCVSTRKKKVISRHTKICSS